MNIHHVRETAPWDAVRQNQHPVNQGMWYFWQDFCLPGTSYYEGCPQVTELPKVFNELGINCWAYDGRDVPDEAAQPHKRIVDSQIPRVWFFEQPLYSPSEALEWCASCEGWDGRIEVTYEDILETSYFFFGNSWIEFWRQWRWGLKSIMNIVSHEHITIDFFSCCLKLIRTII